MITNPSQWQIDNVRSHDKVIVAKKSFIMKLLDFISGFKPELITVKMRSEDNKIYDEKVDKRLVTIFTQEEINSKIVSSFNYTMINKYGQISNVRNGEMVVSTDQLNLSMNGKVYTLPIDVVKQCIEKSNRRFNMLNENSESLDYVYVSEDNATEFEYNGLRYEFINGITFKLIMYRLKDEVENKDKYLIVENLFKLSVSGNDPTETKDKLLRTLADRINLAFSESNDRNYNSFLLEETLDNVIKRYIKITEIKKKEN